MKQNELTILLIIGLIGLAIYLSAHRPGTLPEYTNAEIWSIDWNEEGLPTKVEVRRHAIAGATTGSPKQLSVSS